MSYTTQTPYTLLKQHWERNQYKRGQFVGDAPLDNRSATHRRVLTPSDHRMQVLMHHTIIVTASVDGTITLDSGGWHDSPTTREAFATALRIAGIHAFMHSKRVGNYSQTAISVAGTGTWRFYDGMQLDATGMLISAPKPWTKRVADREARAEKRQELQPLFDVGPLLLAGLVANPDAPHPIMSVQHYDPNKPENWTAIVAYYAVWLDNPDPGGVRVRVRVVEPDWRKVRAAIVNAVTSDMTQLVDVEEA